MVLVMKKIIDTNKAADLLNVSKPYLVKLLDEGKIPYIKIGTQRRVFAKDVLAYKAKEDEARYKILAELIEEAQKLNIGYDE